MKLTQAVLFAVATADDKKVRRSLELLRFVQYLVAIKFFSNEVSELIVPLNAFIWVTVKNSIKEPTLNSFFF